MQIHPFLARASLLLLLWGGGLGLTAQAQTHLNVQNGTFMRTGNGSFVVGDQVDNQTGATLTHEGTLNLTGNLNNDGTFAGISGSVLQFRGTLLQNITGANQVLVGNTLIDNGGNGLALFAPLRLLDSLTLTNGSLFASDANPVLFAPTAANPAESNANHIAGTAIMESRAIGTGAFPSFLGMTMAAGDDLGNVTLTRHSSDGSQAPASSGIQSVNGAPSIATTWTIDNSVGGATAARDVTFDWLSVWDNGQDLTQLALWRTQTFGALGGMWVDESANTNMPNTYTAIGLANLRNSLAFSDVSVSLPIGPPPPLTPIYPPEFIAAYAQDTSRIEVKWLHPWPNEQGFYLYRATEDGNYSQIAIVPPSVGSDTVRYMDTDLDADTQYHYFVRAYRGVDMSTHSDQAEDITYPHTPTVSNLETCYGTAATFLASGTHQSDAYRWYTDSLRSSEALKDGSGAEISAATYQTGYLENDKEVWVRAVGRRYQSWPAKAVATLKPLPEVTLLSDANISSCNVSEILAIQEVAGASYQWYRGGEAVAGATNATYEAMANNRYRVEVTLDGCTAWSDYVSLSLNRKVDIFIEQGEVARFCDAGTLSATAMNGATYEWRKDGNTLGNARTLDVNESGVYQLIANDGTCEVIREITVEIPTFPTDLSLTSSGNDLCPGEEATLNVSNFAGTYNWLRNGRFFTSTDVPTLTTSTPGEYTVEFVDGTCTAQSVSFTLNVNDVPQVRVRRDGDELFLSIEGQVTPTSITWFLDDVAQPSLTGERIAPTQTGVYRAELTFGSCPTGSGGKYFSPSAVTGMEDQPELEDKALVIYPNPTPDALFVQLPQLTGKVSLELVDNLGRTLQRKSQEVSGAETLQLNLKGLPAGTYLLKIHHEELGESLHKIVKE